MTRVALCAASAIALTACHSHRHADPAAASSDTSNQAAAADGTLEQGNYEYDSRTIEMNIPGMPADYGAKQIAMEKSGDVITKVSHCVSRAEALDPRLIFSLGDKACHFPRYSMSGGKIELQLVCQHQPETETKTMTGSYTPTSLSVDMSSTISGGPRSGAEMKMHFDGKRIGDCPPNGS